MFVKKRLENVPQTVIDNVKRYLTEHDLGEFVYIMRKSIFSEDDHLYMVIARKPNVKKYFHNGEWDYSCWTCWNEKTQCMNYGHYNLKTKEDALEILNDFATIR